MVKMKKLARSLEQVVREDYDDDPIAYKDRFYPDAACTELRIIHQALYELIRKRKLLHKVKTLRMGLAYIIRTQYKGDIVAYYHIKHPDIPPRGKLKRINPTLYKLMQRWGKLDAVPKVRADFGKDSLKCCNEICPDYTRREVQVAYPSLYNRMLRDGNIKYIPLSRNGSRG